MKPIRIQLSRKRGWRIPENTVVVSRPSKWGNDWRVGKDGTAAECVAHHKRRLDGNVWTFPTRDDIERELRGKNLACWCKLGAPCHADTLLEIANA